MTGGNGCCHCIHVSELIDRVAAIELNGSATRDPWQLGCGGAPASGAGAHASQSETAGAATGGGSGAAAAPIVGAS